MSESSIRLEIAEGYAVVTLNRPDRLNSFNPEMHQRLRDALDELGQREDIRAVLLTGAGRAFCSGQDLSERRFGPDAPPPDLGASLETQFNPLVQRLRALRKPVVCAVNGVAAGAGANIALACDIVLAGRSATFIQAFCKLGLVPDSGGTYFLPRLVGNARAMGLALLGDRVAADEAERMGLIWKCVDDAALADESRALARHFAVQPTRGLAAIKHALQASALNTLDQQLALERDLQRELGRTLDYREGVTAFLEKRSPRFEGR